MGVGKPRAANPIPTQGRRSERSRANPHPRRAIHPESPVSPCMVYTMDLELERWRDQTARWPASGRHIMAQYDADSVVVYQAYRPEIGEYAVRHQRFGGAFSLSRMSWIKPNFLWMMYRSGWGQKPGQEVVLAVRIARAGFDAILAAAVHSSFVPEVYRDRDAWQAAVRGSDVRLQWDPDHGPGGEPLERRAIQLGLRGAMLADYAHPWIREVIDLRDLVAAQRVASRDELVTPREEPYPVADAAVASRLGC